MVNRPCKSNPPIGSRPYRRAAASFERSSSGDQGGVHLRFHSSNAESASSSESANPRVRRQQTRNVAVSPWSPDTAGGIVAMYRPARSHASRESGLALCRFAVVRARLAVCCPRGKSCRPQGRRTAA